MSWLPRGDNPPLGDKAVTFDLDGTLVDLRAAYVRAHQQAAREVLELELVEERVLELMRTGLPIRAHMELLDELAADRLVAVFVERPCRRSDASCTLTACAPCSGQAEPSRRKAAGKSSSVSFGSIAEYRTDDTERPTG